MPAIKPLSCGIGDWLKAGWELDSDWLPGGCGGIWLPGILAGEIGPDLDWLLPTGEPTGEGDGPPGMLERWGEACGEKGDCAGLLWSPWLLVDPDALTAELRVASVPVGRSSMEPDRSGRLDGLSCCIKFKSSWLDFPGARGG